MNKEKKWREEFEEEECFGHDLAKKSGMYNDDLIQYRWIAYMRACKKRDAEIEELKILVSTIQRMNDELLFERESLQAKLKTAVEALEFYGKENTWLGLTDKVPFDVLKWIRIVEDDMNDYNIGGKKAREALKEIGEV